MTQVPVELAQKKESRRKFIGFSQAIEDARVRRETRTTPAPWIVRKIAVGIVLALWGYSYYVYVVRFCIFQHVKESAPKGLPITFLVVFNLLWLMFGWTYFKVILTPPGFAKDHVHKGPRPEYSEPAQGRPSWDSDESNIGGTPYTNLSPVQTPATSVPTAHSHSKSSPVDVEKTMTGQLARLPKPQDVDEGPRDSGSSPVRRPPPTQTNPKLAPVHARPNTAERNRLELAREHNLPPPFFSRQPPLHPVLLPEYRYCTREGFVKPVRAHHCRTCGTCVLNFDHHCPWIGQCVGARNRKFFIIFLGWCTIFCLWTFGSLLGPTVRSSQGDSFILDPQVLVIIAVAGLFALFTASLFVTQLALVFINVTTVEHLNMGSMKERESAVLSRIHPFWNIRAKRDTRRQWNREWGKIETEGNIWWMGSAKANFHTTMGTSAIRWILPIGTAPSDGLSCLTNPRFDRDGRWRRRSEWPEELR